MGWQENKSRKLELVIIALLTALLGACVEAPPEKIRPTRDDVSRTAPATADVRGKRVLLINSYHEGYPWSDAIVEGARKVLAGTGVEFNVYYMNTKQREDEAWKRKAGDMAIYLVRDWRPDVIITADDNAQQYFGRMYVDTEIPIVFCGVNTPPSKYGYPASNVTGIIERPFFRKSVRLAQQLGAVKKITVLSSEDPTSEGAVQFMRDHPVDCETKVRLVDKFSDWKKIVYESNQQADVLAIYMYHTIRDGDNPAILDPVKVMMWTVENAKIPTLGFFEFGVQDGLLMGVVESGQEHGQEAAKYALEILRGVPIRALPVKRANVGIKMINRDTAKRLGLRLPATLTRGAVVVPET